MLTLHTRVHGEPGRPPVVLLHGLFGSSANWGTVARRLAERHHVLVPDLRNHGQSPHDPDCPYPAQADDVLGLLDRHGLTRVTLVGHSMGGKVAMHLALTRPERVGALAVVDISPVRYTHDFAAALAGFRAVDLASIDSRADADRQMAALVDAPGVRAFFLQNLVKAADGWRWRVDLDAIDAAQAQITDFPDPGADVAYAGTTAFIHGTRSDYVSAADLPTIRRLFPAATLCPVDGAGHWVFADQPQGFMSCLEGFLDRVAVT